MVSREENRTWMLRALRLARRGLGRVSPNPPVAAVAVRDGVAIAEGWHTAFGEPHAEAALIAHAREKGVDLQGADLYVTLEPCGHHGKTPPCSVAILEAGFARVHYATEDPNPATRGLGLRHLQRQGVAVTAGTCEAEARELLAPYLRLTTAGVPLVTAKWAMTADGRTASISGDGRWISSGITRRRTRRERGTVDAILIGRGTAEADDPQLTCRTRGLPDPLRVVLDTKLKLDSWSALVRTISRAPLLLAAAASLEGDAGFEERKGRLEEAGAEMVSLPAGPGGVHLGALLEHLGGRGIANLLVEGGMGVVGSFLDAGLVDRVQVILAPKLSWGENAPAPAGGKGVPSMREALPIHNLQTRKSAGDLILEGSLTAAGRGEWSEPSS